ncbi:MAG: hypothetical protein CVV07_03785 [Gammaproteobacteria bacterium HGW-Gammaproteobacteria-11]|nr:MAG: hypothetical protein CVV07_03785 [Gammaproteobacteria bacterium HGW-Gammaproteobacteria-11]
MNKDGIINTALHAAEDDLDFSDVQFGAANDNGNIKPSKYRLLSAITGFALFIMGILVICVSLIFMPEAIIKSIQYCMLGIVDVAVDAFFPIYFDVQFALLGFWICKRSIRLLKGQSWSVIRKGEKAWFFPFIYPVYALLGTFIFSLGIYFMFGWSAFS